MYTLTGHTKKQILGIAIEQAFDLHDTSHCIAVAWNVILEWESPWWFASPYMHYCVLNCETLQYEDCYNADSESCNKKIIRHRVTVDAKNYVEVIVSKIHVDMKYNHNHGNPY